jgi:benzylsuccinate CoA-transferase BbsF subunit
MSLMVALDYRRRTGKGQYIDHAQIEAGLNYAAPLILDYVANKRELALKGNKCDFAAPHGVYRCQGDDRWVAIAVETDEEWQSFGRVVGSPDWVSDPKYATLASRIENSEELDSLVEKWTVNYTPEQVMTMLQEAGVGAGVVANAKDMDEDTQLNHYNFYHEMDHPYMGKLRYYHPPAFKLSAVDADFARPVLLGEHTDYVCHEILGMPEDEIARLRQKGVFD